jgi:hypothetical protein
MSYHEEWEKERQDADATQKSYDDYRDHEMQDIDTSGCASVIVGAVTLIGALGGTLIYLVWS